MQDSIDTHLHRSGLPWNRGKLIGPKPPLKAKDIWSIRVRLQLTHRVRDLALFNLALDSKLRACDLVALRVDDVALNGRVRSRAAVLQRKTGQPVQFEITEHTREAVGRWLEKKSLHKGEPLFPSRVDRTRSMTTRQYARLLASWLRSIGLDPLAYGTHSLRRTKASMIYRRTGNLRAVQLLLGHTKIESTVRYLGIDVDALVFVSLVTLLLSPRGDQAYAGGVALALGVAVSVLVTAIINFAVLPALETFPAFCVAIGLVLIPAGFGMAYSRKPLASAVLAGVVTTFMPLLAPTNEMIYDPAKYYNSALAVFAGSAAALISFRLLPPLSPALRTHRLLASSLRDLRRVVTGPVPRTPDAWDRRMFGRLSALPDDVEPLQRLQLMAALSMGAEIIHLRQMAQQLGVAVELDAALEAIAQGHSAVATVRLRQLDRHLASRAGGGPDAAVVLRARGRILAISEVLAQHVSYFDAGVPA